MGHVLETNQSFLDGVRNPRKNGFVTVVSFTNEATLFNPTAEEVVQMLRQNADDIVNTVNGLSRLLFEVLAFEMH